MLNKMLTHTMMMERLRHLLNDDEWPEGDTSPAHTDEELRARAPDGSIPEDPVCCLKEYDRRFNTQYHNPYIQWYCGSCKSTSELVDVQGVSTVMARPSKAKPPKKDDPVGTTSEDEWPTVVGVRKSESQDESLSSSPPRAFGELSPLGQKFSPIMAISKFPYKYIRHSKSEAVADAFFNEGKFWNREWEIYYLWAPYSVTSRPVMFVPTTQVKELLKDINANVPDCSARFPSNAEELGLVNTFGKHPQLRPRFLGFSYSRARYDELQRMIPGENFRPKGEEEAQDSPDEETLIAHKLKLDIACDAAKARKKAGKAAKQEEQFSKKRQWRTDLKQTERFVGLRPVAEHSSDATNESWDQYLAAQQTKKHTRDPSRILVTESPPYQFHKSVIFVSIDIECYEKDKAKITEIGLSTLDTKDLAHLPPGLNAVNWRDVIRSRHFRIREHAHLKNGEYVNDCSNQFDWGTSEWITLKDAPAVIASCFRPPYSATLEDELGVLQISEDPVEDGIPDNKKRTIVLVGHDLSNDLRYLLRLGYDVTNLSNLYPSYIDTASLYRAFMHEWNPKSLGSLCVEFDIIPYHLHNGGNDARYTMEVMLGIAVKSASERGSQELKDKIAERHEEKVNEAVEAARSSALREAEGWDSDEDIQRVNEGHGGVQLPL